MGRELELEGEGMLQRAFLPCSSSTSCSSYCGAKGKRGSPVGLQLRRALQRPAPFRCGRELFVDRYDDPVCQVFLDDGD